MNEKYDEYTAKALLGQWVYDPNRNAFGFVSGRDEEQDTLSIIWVSPKGNPVIAIDDNVIVGDEPNFILTTEQTALIECGSERIGFVSDFIKTVTL